MSATIDEDILHAIRAEFRRLDLLTGVDTSAVEIALSDRLVSRYGLCKFQRRGGRVVPCRIVIARFLLGEGEPFWETARHEYAHAAASLRTGRQHGHDAVWKSLCRIVGARPSSRADECEGHRRKRAETARYVVRCARCGAVFERMRRSPFVEAVERGAGGETAYRCRCGGRAFTLEKRD